MARKDTYLNTAMYVLFVILILLGCTMGLQPFGHSVKHVVDVQTYGGGADVAVVAAVAAPASPTDTSKKTNNKSTTKTPVVHTVHAKDIIKGKAVTNSNKSAGQQAQISETAQSNPKSTSKGESPANKTQGITVGEFVERAGLGFGIFVKKETRTAIDGLVRLLEQTKVQ